MKLASLWTLAIAMVVLPLVLQARPSGAPAEACQSMTPNHHEPPQKSPPPYTIAVTRNATAPIYHVVLQGEKFRGLFLQARFVNNGSLVDGRFVPDNLSKPVACGQSQRNSLTHTNNFEKNEITTVWYPKSFFTEPFVFRATVVKDYATYWKGVDSRPLVLESYSLDIYEECGKTRGCFGLPSNCIQKEDRCQLLVMFRPVSPAAIEFHLISALGANEGWAAVGLSLDPKMGEDLVTECILDPSQGVKVLQSWNFGQPDKYNVLLELDALQAVSGIYDNGILTCSWRQSKQVLRGATFDPMNQEYFILLAKGALSAFQTKQEHSVRLPSAYLVNFTQPILVVGRPSLLVKLHGSLMVAAWVGVASLGMIIARYFKQTWARSLCCNTKMWFMIHRGLMLLATSLIISAFVLIFIYEDGWTTNPKSWHPICGCVATGLATLQVVGGLLRPSPNSRFRSAFNVLHWLSGNIAFIVALAAIYLALGLKEANLPPLFLYALLSFVGVHFISHMFLQLQACVLLRHSRGRVVDEASDGKDKSQQSEEEDSPGSGFRKAILGIYSICLGVAVAAMIYFIWFN